MRFNKLFFPLWASIFFLPPAHSAKVKKVACSQKPHSQECRPVLRLDARRPFGLGQKQNKNTLTWKDLSRSHLTGRLEGGYTSRTNPWIKQKKNRPASLSFNGVDQYVNFGTVPELQLRNAFAIEIWFKPIVAPGENIDSQMLVNKEGEYEIAIYGATPSSNRVWFALANLQPGWTFR